MPGFFDKLKNAVTMRVPYTSSAGHRHAQRSNAVAEVVGQGLEAFNPAAIIPGKFAQTLISMHGLFRGDTHVSEKIIHFLQAGLSTAHMGLAITLFFQSGVCGGDLEGDICKALFLCDLLYKGTLLVGWVPSEASKDATTSEDSTALTV